MTYISDNIINHELYERAKKAMLDDKNIDLYDELILLNSSNNSRIYKKWIDNL